MKGFINLRFSVPIGWGYIFFLDGLDFLPRVYQDEQEKEEEEQDNSSGTEYDVGVDEDVDAWWGKLQSHSTDKNWFDCPTHP